MKKLVNGHDHDDDDKSRLLVLSFVKKKHICGISISLQKYKISDDNN